MSRTAQHLRSPNMASAKIKDLHPLFSSANSAYALPVLTHSELALVGYQYIGTQSAPNAVFLCAKSFGIRPSMVKLKGTRPRVPVSYVTGRPTLSALPPYLVVSGKASIQYIGVTPMTNTAQNPSKSAANTSFISLHNPTDPATESYTFDTLEAAQTFKQNHCLSAYRIAHVELFDAVENGGVFA